MAGQWLRKEVLLAVKKIQPIAEECGLTLPQLAVAWVLQNPQVSSAIIGASKPEQVKENVKAAGVRLDEQVMRQLDSILNGIVERDPRKTG